MTPEELCKAYRDELARVYGKEIAKESRVDYARGWYYITIAHRYSDGSIGYGGRLAGVYRKKQVLERLENLRERPNKPGKE